MRGDAGVSAESDRHADLQRSPEHLFVRGGGGTRLVRDFRRKASAPLFVQYTAMRVGTR